MWHNVKSKVYAFLKILSFIENINLVEYFILQDKIIIKITPINYSTKECFLSFLAMLQKDRDMYTFK